jgi:multidrug efflux pump
MDRRFNLSQWGLRNGALTGFLMALVLIAGGWAWDRLGRAEDPSFTLKVMVVSAAWPGATAEQMQAQVADRIESRLQDLPWLDVLQTYTRPGQAVTTVLLRDTTPPHLVAGLWYEVRKRVGDIVPTLPAGVRGPFFNDEYSDVYSAVMALRGADNAELIRQAERIRLRLLRLPGAGRVLIDGEQPQRVFVEVSHARMATLGIEPQAVAQALASFNPIAPAGVVETGSTRFHLRVDGALDGLDAIRAVPIAVAGGSIRLGDLAEVRRGVADPPDRAIRHEGEPAVMIALAKAPGVNVLRLGDALRAEFAAIRAGLPAGLTLDLVTDQARIVAYSVDEFLGKFAAAIAVVLLVCFLSLGLRAGVIVALSVPLTISVVLVFLLIRGTELERISLGAMILALGLLVDDAIIAIEAMLVKLDQGWDRMRAAGFAWSSTASPMLYGTLVTVAGFIPVGFAASTSGEYAGGIFWVVGAALLASWVVAVFFTPVLGAWLLNVKPGAAHHDGYTGRFHDGFRSVVGWCVDRRWIVAGATIGVMVAGVAGMGMVKQQFFPTSQRVEILVDINLREGAAFAATDAVARRVEATLRGDRDASTYTSYLGAGAPRFFLALNPDLPNEAFAKVVIQAADLDARERLIARLQREVEAGRYPEARVRVSRLEFGPPVGFPVQFRVVGPDPVELRRVADEAAALLRATPGTQNVQLAWSERMPTLRVALDLDRIAQLGLSPQAVSTGLAMLLGGQTATQLREGTRMVDVVLRAPPAERGSLEGLGDLTLLGPAGPVPLSQVARLVPATEEPILWRRNREGFLTVRADVRPGFQAPDVTAAAEPAMRALAANLQPGYRIETGGASEEAGRANASLFALMPVMVAVMLLTTSVFWGPMAIAMIGGLTLATFATLLVVPALHGFALRRAVPGADAPRPVAAFEPAE